MKFPKEIRIPKSKSLKEIIAGFEEGLSMLEEEVDDLKPNIATFTSLISAVSKGKWIHIYLYG